MPEKKKLLLNKLLLVRKAAARSTLLDRMGASKFSSGEPVAVSPLTWDIEAGHSHYAYLLKDMTVKDLAELDKWVKENEPEALTFHTIDLEAEAPVVAVLEKIGLRINEAAE